jgi:PAS domain S-box-containing protein
MKLFVHKWITAGSKPPLGWLALAVLFTISMFFWLGWHVYNSSLMIEEISGIYVNNDNYWHKVIDLSRQITLTARTVAIDQDTTWLNKYRRLVTEFDIILQAQSTLRIEYEDDIDLLAQARSAQQGLRIIEESALDQIQSGRSEAGLKSLFDENYDRQEQVFLNAMNDFIEQSRQRLINKLNEEKIKELQSLWAAFFIFLISFSFWIMLIRRLQRWGDILSQEIIEHRKAEEAARKSEQKYQDLFEYANEPIFIVDPNTHRFLDFNQQAMRSLNYERHELLELQVEDVIVETTEGCDDKIVETLCTGANTASECTFRRKDGTLFPVEISGRLIGHGENTVYQCFARDITERKRFQEERLHAQKIEAIGQLAGGIVHDFGNLLLAITGYVTIAKRRLPAFHAALMPLQQIEQATEQANGMVKALLTFGCKQAMEWQPVELRELVTTTVQIFRGFLPAAIALETDVTDAPAFWVSGDKTQFQQVLMNLMINARDAMPEGGTLRFSLSLSPTGDNRVPASADTPGSWVYLRVSDTGTGMTPEIQARIFEPFFTTKPRGQGTGLGLPMVHGIVVQHGGRLEVQSAVGLGSTFTVVLPAITPPNSARPDPASWPNLAHGKGETILLAEDHRYVREIMATILQSQGYQVVQADTGTALLESYRACQARLRLLIVDLDLPQRNGLDCVRQMRAEGERLPVIFTTGMEPPADLTGQLDDRTVLLRKPFQMATLARLVASLIAEQSPGS